MRPLLRLPLWARVFSVVFLVVWLGIVVTSATRSDDATGRLVGVLFAVVGIAIVYRNLRIGVDGADRLVVRNQLRNQVIARADIEGFRTGSPTSGGSGGLIVYVVTSSHGVVGVLATQELSFLPGARRRIAESQAVLERWLAEPVT